MFTRKFATTIQLTLETTGLTALAVFDNGKPSQAASLGYRPGNFSNSVIINVNFGFSPNNLPDFTANLTGTTRIFFSSPVDALINDPLLGNVGSVDGNLDVLKTEFVSSISTGATPFVPVITAVVGDNVPDLAPTPSDSDLPFESLHSTGAIVKSSDSPALTDTFFNLFLEIQGTPEGRIRNQDPLTLKNSSPLVDFPPGTALNVVDYVSTEITQLFAAGDDGVFWTGDEIEVARLVPDTSGRAVVLNLNPISVPEPSTKVASILIILGIISQLKRKK